MHPIRYYLNELVKDSLRTSGSSVFEQSYTAIRRRMFIISKYFWERQLLYEKPVWIYFRGPD